ncbi:MAG: iron dependent repressor, metal binding and dimerization domain protein [Clostridium sp.]
MDNPEIFRTVRGYQLKEYKNNTLTSSMEDYLEMIYRVTKDNEYLRVGELAKLLHVKPSSSTKMVEKLSNLGLLDSKNSSILILSTEGRKIGEFLLNRHNIIEAFLRLITSSDNILVETELIEHNLSKNTVESIIIFNEFFKQNQDIYNIFLDFKDNYK